MVRNVLVAPLLAGKKEAEWNRMLRILKESAPHRIHVIRMPGENERYAESPRHVHDKLSELRDGGRFELDEHSVDVFNVEATMTLLAGIHQEELGNDIVYSMATGLAPGAMVGTMACLVWGWRGLYVGGTPPKEIVAWVPSWLRVEQALSQQELRVLKILAALPEGEALDKGALIDELLASGVVPKDPGKHKYRRLATQFLKRLEEAGLVEVDKRDDLDGRQRFVWATQEGRRAFRMFGPTLREPSAVLHLRGPKAAPAKARL